MSYNYPLVNIAGGGIKYDYSTNSMNLAALDIRYVNQSGDVMQGNIDMNKHEIQNVKFSTDKNSVTTKDYVDNEINKTKTENDVVKQEINNLKEKFDEFKNETLPKYSHLSIPRVAYFEVAIKFKPNIWLSSKFPEGLFPDLKQTGTNFLAGNVMKNEVVYLDALDINAKFGDIYCDNVSIQDGAYEITAKRDTRLIPSRLQINIYFYFNYTFIFIARKVNEEDKGYIFSSLLPNRIFGWNGEQKFFKVNETVISNDENKNTNLHCYVVRCQEHSETEGRIDFWDLDEEIKRQGIVTEKWGKVVIGTPKIGENGNGLFYELMLFDKWLSDNDITEIKKLFKSVYDFTPKTKKLKPIVTEVVDESFSKNLA